MSKRWFRLTALLTALLLCGGALADGVEITIIGADGTTSEVEAVQPEAALADDPADPAAREAFIDRIIALAKEKFDAADGRAQRAQYSGDIYVCKNFTV